MDENSNVMMDEEFGVDLSDIVDEPDQDGNQTDDLDTQDTAENQQQETEPTRSPEQPDTSAPDNGQKEPELYELKVNKGVQKVTLDQMRELAQQGQDYGRVRQQRDTLQQSLNDQMQWRSQNETHLTELSEVAKAAGMDVPGFLNSLRVNLLVQQGLSRETAQERIRAERAERQVMANQQQAQQQKNTQAQQEQTRQRQEQDVRNFLRIYSGVDPRSIPQSVWSEVQNGDTLVSAYGRYQNQQLQNQIKELNAKLEAQKQNTTNKQRSLGSVKSSGNNSVKDDFLEGFND